MWTVDNWYQMAFEQAAKKADLTRGMADLILNTYQSHMPNASREEIVRQLKESNRQRLAALPSLAKYPELRGMDRLIEARWRGTRDGAKLNDDQWAANCNWLFYYHRYLNNPAKPHAANCSYVYFPTSEVGPILANNLDSSPAEPFGEPTWPAASEHLIFGGVSSGVFCDEQSPEIFPAPVFEIAGRYCRSTDEAVDLLRRYNHFWGPGNMIVIDRNHGVAMIEKSACRMGVRRSPDGFGFITAMTAEDPDFNAYLASRRKASLEPRGLTEESDDVYYWRAQDRRRELMNRLLAEAKKNPSVEALRSIIQYRSKEHGNVAGNGDILRPGGAPAEFTLRTSLFLLREGKAMWWAKEGDTPSYENRKPDVVYKDVWTWN